MRRIDVLATDRPLVSTSATAAATSFGAMLRGALGESLWSTLDPAIQRRFAPSPSAGKMQRYAGVIHWVYCSPIGALIARLLRPAAVLPDRCGRNVAFEFRIESEGGKITKQRVYRWVNGEPFVFRSVFGHAPRLNEEFRGGLGMYLELVATKNALLFRDKGYFLRLGSVRIPLPRWLSVGTFELLHRSIDEQRFQVLIRITHPLFGTLFYQRGEFRDEC